MDGQTNVEKWLCFMYLWYHGLWIGNNEPNTQEGMSQTVLRRELSRIEKIYEEKVDRFVRSELVTGLLHILNDALIIYVYSIHDVLFKFNGEITVDSSKCKLRDSLEAELAAIGDYSDNLTKHRRALFAKFANIVAKKKGRVVAKAFRRDCEVRYLSFARGYDWRVLSHDDAESDDK
jgi:hypothetical protein